MKKLLILMCVASFIGGSNICHAQASQSLRGQAPANREMKSILDADNADRPNILVKDFSVIDSADKMRRERVMQLLRAGELRNGGDYRAAAFVFQHGSSARDYLLAHILAMTAVQLGDEQAKWIETATLDRFLMVIGQSQVFGTQFAQQDGPDKPYTQRPYDKELIPDPLRKTLGVGTIVEQERQLLEIEKQRIADK